MCACDGGGSSTKKNFIYGPYSFILQQVHLPAAIRSRRRVHLRSVHLQQAGEQVQAQPEVDLEGRLHRGTLVGCSVDFLAIQRHDYRRPSFLV